MLQYSAAALNRLHKDITELSPKSVQGRTANSEKGDQTQIELSHSIELENVTFRYPGARTESLRNISLRIPAGASVGFVGTTGSGKTTVVDIILGLLRPTLGDLIVDGQRLADTDIRSWQRILGYVPQDCFLSDDTVARNIAFGQTEQNIDQDRVERAAEIACIHDFVMQDLPNGYETLIGERGVRLSGGQRQRIGIARALYDKPDVLVLDEATNALDNVTERNVMEGVHGAGKTLILIAHRLTTVQDCDVIFFLEKGDLLDMGSFDEIAGRNPKFRALASAD